MKTVQQSRRIARRSGTILGLMALFLSFAMMGGADPAAQIDAARTVKEKVEAAAQEESDANARQEGEDVVLFEDDAGGDGGITRRDDGKIDVSLKNTPLKEAVQAFALTAGVNIIPPYDIQSNMNVTVTLVGVDWEPALREILRPRGLYLRNNNGLYSVSDKLSLITKTIVNGEAHISGNIENELLPVVIQAIATEVGVSIGFGEENFYLKKAETLYNPNEAPKGELTEAQKVINAIKQAPPAQSTNNAQQASYIDYDKLPQLFQSDKTKALGALRVTIVLNDIPWKDAVETILDIHDLQLETIKAGYIIKDNEIEAVQTFFLKYTTVDEMGGPIKDMVLANSVINLFASRNAIVVRSTADNLREVAKLIQELDRPGKQVLIETKIMELSDSAMKELGVRWDSLKEFGVGADLKPFNWSQTSTDTRTTEQGSDRLNQAYQVDTRRRFDPQEDETYSAVGNWDYGTSENNDFINSGIGKPGADSYVPGRESFSYGSTAAQDGSSVLDSFTRSIVESQSAILNVSSLSVILSALESMDGVSLVSNPKMIVTSGATNALFRVGEREPIIATEIKKGTTDSPGDTITSKLDTSIETEFISGGYFRTGIDLQVVPTVKTDDYIEALLHPSLSRKLGEKFMGSNSWPIVNIKEILTTVTLRSGQTVAIGGLTDSKDQKVTTRVPFLGRIPIIGRLFSHEETKKSQVETIIFVTLSIANPDELQDASGIPDDARLVHKRRMQDQINRQEFDQQLAVQKEAVAKATQAKAEADSLKTQEEAEAEAKAVLEKAEADAKKATDLQPGKKAKKKPANSK